MFISMRLSVLSLLLAPFIVACGSDAHPGFSGDDPTEVLPDGGTPTAHIAGNTADGGEISHGCADGREGCPCDKRGDTTFCGWIKRTSGTYVACSPGEATCEKDLTWGPCVGDRVASSTTTKHGK
jgi:hypothetical protein